VTTTVWSEYRLNGPVSSFSSRHAGRSELIRILSASKISLPKGSLLCASNRAAAKGFGALRSFSPGSFPIKNKLVDRTSSRTQEKLARDEDAGVVAHSRFIGNLFGLTIHL
jgi:hypothetical protein